MSEEDLDKIREAGERMGRLLQQVADLQNRLGRLEAGVLAILGGILATWAKSKGLW
jgi:hypothetical protein